jgi:hypothetical protein
MSLENGIAKQLEPLAVGRLEQSAFGRNEGP